MRHELLNIILFVSCTILWTSAYRGANLLGRLMKISCIWGGLTFLSCHDLMVIINQYDLVDPALYQDIIF